MKLNERDGQILQHIVKYCYQAEDTITTFGRHEQKFMTNHIYQNALSMNILQIGELVAHLSNEFKEEHSEIPWRSIIGMRNRFVHGYDAMDLDVIWDTATQDITDLNRVCQKCLQTWNIPIPKKSSVCISNHSYSR